jgi:hypothetical protein
MGRPPVDDSQITDVAKHYQLVTYVCIVSLDRLCPIALLALSGSRHIPLIFLLVANEELNVSGADRASMQRHRALRILDVIERHVTLPGRSSVRAIRQYDARFEGLEILEEIKDILPGRVERESPQPDVPRVRPLSYPPPLMPLRPVGIPPISSSPPGIVAPPPPGVDAPTATAAAAVPSVVVVRRDDAADVPPPGYAILIRVPRNGRVRARLPPRRGGVRGSRGRRARIAPLDGGIPGGGIGQSEGDAGCHFTPDGIAGLTDQWAAGIVHVMMLLGRGGEKWGGIFVIVRAGRYRWMRS